MKSKTARLKSKSLQTPTNVQSKSPIGFKVAGLPVGAQPIGAISIGTIVNLVVMRGPNPHYETLKENLQVVGYLTGFTLVKPAGWVSEHKLDPIPSSNYCVKVPVRRA